MTRPVPYQFDLRDLCVYDENFLYDLRSNDMEAIKSNMRDAAQAFVNRIWKLPSKESDDKTTILAELPEFYAKPKHQLTIEEENLVKSKLPRAKPIPKAKPLTRWQKFAKEKGIKKTKRSRLVWDDQKKDWVPRHGKDSKLNQEMDSWLVEVPNGADDITQGDMYSKMRREKKDRVKKNLVRMRKNLTSRK